MSLIITMKIKMSGDTILVPAGTARSCKLHRVLIFAHILVHFICSIMINDFHSHQISAHLWPCTKCAKYVLREKKSTFTVGHLNSIVEAESIEFIMMGNKRSIDIHLLLGMPDTDIDFRGNLYKCLEVRITS